MTHRSPRGFIWAVTSGAVFIVAALALASAQQPDWYPSQWGADDQRGAAHRLTPAKVLEARDLMRTGQVYQLGRVYEPGIPLFGTRQYTLTLAAMQGPLGDNQSTYFETMFRGEIDQIGTQFDALGHFGIGDLYYNGHVAGDIATDQGLTRLGVEQAGVFVTRGVLIDVAAYKGVAMLDDSYHITAADLRGALARQGTEIHAGDVVLLHTGWGSLWMRDNDRFGATEPGIGLGGGQFLVDEEIVMVGADTWGTEVVPNPDPTQAFPVHQLLITKHGIYNIENLATEVLAADRVYEFAFIYTPLRLKGAPGSPGNPIAIR